MFLHIIIKLERKSFIDKVSIKKKDNKWSRLMKYIDFY